MSLRALREKINLFLYSSKERNLSILQYISFFVSLAAIILLVIYYGFPLTPGKKHFIIGAIRISLIFYILSYFIRIVYAFQPRRYIKSTWFEGLLMLVLLFDALSRYIAGESFLQTIFDAAGLRNFRDYYIVFIQVYLLLIVGLDLGQVMGKLPRLNLEPSTLFILSFLFLIFMGTGLLMLPEMTTRAGGMPFHDALFTSVSASCVTGLTVVDTGTYFTAKGHVVILLLVQLGGLSIISFATLFTLLSGSVGIKHQSYLKEVLSSESLKGSKGLISRIVTLSLGIELAGAIIIFGVWQPDIVFESTGDKIFYSVFHAISAFNNAGFSLFPQGLATEGISRNYILHLVIASMVIMGSLGFPAIRDLFGLRSLRQRMKLPWKQIRLGTKIAVYTNIALLVIGTLAFFVFERESTMRGMLFAEQLITSFVHAVYPRSSGFNTLDFAHLTQPMLIIFILLMFIGASPGSTGGGIKTTTFTLLIFSAWATVRGKRNLEIGRQFISGELLNRAFSVAFFASAAVFTGVLILSITDPHIPILDLVFEEVSAFATVGHSTGITQQLSPAGRMVLIVSMFTGRVGILTLAFSLSRRVATSNYRYPNAHVMVG